MNNVTLIVRMLERAGVRHVFGVPSGPVLPLIEALRESVTANFVLTASETSAGFMAEATGRLTGVPGVCVSTVGPGATNMTTGVGAAWLDRSPVIAITCNYVTSQLSRRTQMLIDHHALFAPITKASYRLEEGRVASILAQSIGVALSEPPGPVHLDLPEDVGIADATEPVRDMVPSVAVPSPSLGLAGEVEAHLRGAVRPLVVTGLTFTRAPQSARDDLLRFIDTQQVPFVTTLNAKGFLPETHHNSLGVMGRARRTDVQRMIDRADLILAVGFDPVEIDYEDWAGDTALAHLSNEPVQPGTRANVICEGVGSLRDMLSALAALPSVANQWDTASWAEHRSSLAAALRPRSQGMATHHVLDVLRGLLPPDAILTYDVGAHTHQIATQWSTDLSHTAVATNGWSSMGYGMPAAYAAKLANPDRVVVAVVGDGGFQMTVGELAAARRLGLRVPVVVLNDGWLGLMKVKQERLDYGSSGALLGEQVDPPSHYFGVPVRVARDERSLADSLRWALALDGPSVVEAYVDVEPYSTTVFDQ